MKNFILDKNRFIINNGTNSIPIKNEPDYSSNSSWLKSADGSISQKVFGTIGDIGINTLKGVNSIGTGLKNTLGTTFINTSGPLIGHSELLLPSQEKQQREEWKQAAVNKLLNYNPISDRISKIESKVDKYSVLGNKSDSIASGIGYYGGMIALEMAGIPWQGTAFSTTYGTSYDEAIKSGASREMATLYSLGSAAAEVASEYVFDGIKLKGTGKTTSQIIDSGISKIKSDLIKKLMKFGVSVTGEGIEEIISGTASEIMKRITYMKDDDINIFQNIANGLSDYKTNQMWSDFISGVLVSAITGGIQNIHNRKRMKQNLIQLENNNEDNIVNNEANKAINNTERENVKVIQEKINELELLQSTNQINNEQSQELIELKKQLSELQQNQMIGLNSTSNSTTKTEISTVQDIVNQEESNTKNVDLPIYNQQSNINNSDKPILPTVNDFNSSNVNMPTSDIKIDVTKIKPEILNDVKGFKLGDPSIESYKGSYIKTMLNEVGIKVPAAMDYVSEVRPDISFTTTKDLTRQQYASIGNALQKLKNVDITGVNNINEAITPTNILPIGVSQINQVKGNIPINQELLNKYKNTNEMFSDSINNYNGEVNIKDNLSELQNISVEDMKIGGVKKLAKEIFQKYNKSNTFYNNDNKILVNKTGIDESITKIFESRQQRELLKEHMLVFSDLGDIIEHSKLVNQAPETKGRKKYNSWNYYYDGLKIGNNSYNFEFEVVSMSNGENHYRVQKLEKINNKKAEVSTGSTNIGTLPVTETSAFSSDNIPQSNNNVNSDILPTINNMQNSEKNTNKILNPNEISKLTKEDANTTPTLPVRANINKVNDGDSHFAKNIKDKVNMLNVEQKAEILSKEYIRYYDKVTNKESLEKAFKRLNDGGKAEVTRWFNNNENIDSSDVAEGYILLKQYSDKAENAINLAEKDYYNEMVVETAKKMRKLGTTTGQIVQAFNIMERMTPEGMVKYAQSELSEAYDRMVKNKTKEWIDKHREDFDLKPDEVQFIMDTMKEVSKMEDGYDKRVKLAEIQKLMTDKLPPEKGAKIRSWMRISMLFNSKTQVRNVAGNALIMPVNSFGDLFSSYVDKLIAKKTGVRTTGNTNIKAMLEGIKRGAYEATNDYKKGINTKDMEGNRFEISDGKSFSEKNLMGRALNRTESLLNYVMDVGDRVFSEAAFENSLQNQLALNNTTEITQEMIDIAHQEALSRTWNDNNNYTRFVLGVRKGLNKLNVNGYGLGDVLIPFAKTPANLTKAIVDYSPAGLVSAINKGINLKRSLTNGQYTATMQHEFVQSLGKATAGTMLYILGIALAKAGITSGDSDDDKDTANFLKNTLGINSYSIKIGGKSFTYDWAQPLAAPLSITANVVNSKSGDSKALLEGIVGSLDSAGSILLEQSFLQSINDVLNDNDGVVSGIINEILELPARAVPTFSKQIADLVDGTQRTSFEYGKPIQSAVNSIKAKIPFVSKTLNPAVDTMGREIQKYGGKNNIFNVFLNPANVSTENISESAEEIYRLYKETGVQTIMPRVAPYYINKNGEKITMTSKERAEYQKISGKIIEDNVQLLLKDNSYKEMNDTEKTEVINKIINYSYNKAREEVLGIEMSNEYNKINSYVNDGGKVANYYLNKKEIDYSYTNPSKYKVITQITTYNNYLSYKKNLDEIKDNYTNTSQRKTAIIKYVNSLNLTIPQKAMLIKMNYSSYNSYNNQIINYVNNQNISLDEKKEILEELGFKVRNGKVYSK